jgi:zinc protease
MNAVRETQIDGVLCFHVDTGRPASAAHLLFRQGLADEPLHETGWLHLLEHLALLDRETLTRPIEGRQTLLLTHFAAFGGPEAITEHMGALARWLAEPDLRLLARERGILQAAAHEAADGLIRSLTWRYGAAGPGVASYAEVGAIRATEHGLVERSRRVFNAENAILVLDGPPPAGLSVPLPAGEYLHAPAAVPVDRPLPAAYRDEAGLTLSGVVTRTHEAGFLPDILQRALHDGLRRHSGGAYGLWSSMTDVDNRHAVVAAGADVVPEMLRGLSGAALDVIERLAANGVPRDWVQEAVDRRLRVLESPAAMVETALEGAYAALAEQVPLSYEELLEQLRTTNPVQVDQAVRELHASLLVGLPEAAPLGRTLAPVTFTDTRPVGTGVKHNHVNWPADLTTFSVDDQVVERVTGTLSRTMRLRDVVGLLAWRDGARHLIGRDGAVLELEPREWSKGKDLTKAIDAAVPSELQVTMPDRAVTFQRMSVGERSAMTFARFANTRAGLSSMLALFAVLALWAMVGGHRIVGAFLLVLAGALGAHLWRTEAAAKVMAPLEPQSTVDPSPAPAPASFGPTGATT